MKKSILGAVQTIGVPIVHVNYVRYLFVSCSLLNVLSEFLCLEERAFNL